MCVLLLCGYGFFFFFSSRRRHTRCSRDWSSDVCSSDLGRPLLGRRLAYGVGLAALASLAAIGILTRSPARSGTSHPAPQRMLVVLPFENLGRPDDEYFADGMTEEVTGRLAGLHGLRVIARTSARQYKKTTKTIPQIGQDLGVDYVLEGSIRWDKPPH